MNEATIQSKVRIAASTAGWRLWRNNVGQLLDAKGRPIRYGLANESANVNQMIKSGDLIGIRPMLITAAMVGSTIGQFVSIECKTEGWNFRPTNEREAAQLAWAALVNSLSGYATFNSTGEL